MNVPSKTNQEWIKENILLKQKIQELEKSIAESRRKEEALWESENRYRSLFQNSLDAVLLTAPDGRIMAANPAACRIFGRTEEEICRIGRKHMVDLTDPRLAAALEERELTGSFRGELTFVRKNGTLFPGEISSVNFRDRDGNSRTSMIIRDITERKKTEDKIKKQTDAMEAAIDGIALLNDDEEYTYLNQAHARIYGYEHAGELIGKSWRILYDADEIKRFDAEIMPKLGQAGYWQGEALGMKKDGSKFPQEVSLTALGDGLICVVRDITERKQIEAELRERDIQFKKLSSWVPGMIYQLTRRPDGTYCVPFATEGIRDIFGCSPQDVYEDFAPIVRVILPEDLDKLLGSLEYSAKHLTVWSYEYRVQIPGQSIRWMLGNAIPEKVDDGSITWHGFNTDITKRKRAEEALKESEEQYRSLFENANEAIFVVQDNKLVFLNPMTTIITGYSGEELMSRPFIEFIHADDREMIIDRHVRRMKGEKLPHLYSFRILHKNGNTKWVELNAVLMDWKGKPATLNFLSDINERKMAEEALRETSQILATIIRSAPLSIIAVDNNDKVIIWNPVAEHMFGWTQQEILNQPIPTIPHVKTDEFEQLRKSARHQDIVQIDETYRMKKDGSMVAVSVSVAPLKDAAGHVIGRMGILTDISERKRAEEELIKSERKYRNIFETAMEGIYQSSLEGKYITVNPAFAKMLGYETPEELMSAITDIAGQLYVNPDKRSELIKQLRISDCVEDFEFQMYRKDRTIIWLLINARFVRDKKGNIKYFEGRAQDITHRKSIEEKLKNTLESLRSAVGATVQVIVSAVESRDPYTAGHQIRVADLARAIATEMGLPKDRIEGIRMAGAIHDIGKLSIPAEILSKPTKLTDIEFSLIKEHSRGGYEILKDVESPWPLAQIVYQHHERMDGSGYPRNLKGDEILMEARIMAAADVVEAMASHRPYRPGLGIEAALEEIEKNRGILYDNTVADACLSLFHEKGYQLERT